MHVLIIGGGMAGMALAQCLRKKNISCDVFERDNDASARKQNWAVVLRECIPKLRPLLPVDVDDLASVSNVRRAGLPDSGAIYNALTGKIIMKESSTDGEGHLIHASRANMRAYLSGHVPVHWGKKFVRFEEDAHGVVAVFEDGERAKGDVLVGADGAASRVRAELLNADSSSALMRTLPYGVIGGEPSLPFSTWNRICSDGNSYMVAFGQDGSLIFAGLRDALQHGTPLTPESIVQVYYHLYWVDEAAANDQKAYWTQDASKKELRAKALELTKDWVPNVRDMVLSCPEEDMMQPPFMLREFVPPEEGWKKGKVTLVGDAAHSMAPLRGAGANTALRDVVDLTVELEKASNNSGEQLPSLLKSYEAEMIPRGREIVMESRHSTPPDQLQ